MNDRIILQVPMSRELKEKAHEVARDYGFSSLQDTIRLLLTKLSKREISVEIEEKEEVVHLSKRAEKRYKKAIEEIENGRNITNTKNIDELFSQLE